MVVNFWLFQNGFSIGIGDTIAHQKTMSYITQTIAELQVNVAKVCDQVVMCDPHSTDDTNFMTHQCISSLLTILVLRASMFGSSATQT